MNYILIALIWSAYCFIHSFLISIRFTNLMKSKLKSFYAFYRLFYVIISIALLIPALQYSGKLATGIIFTYSFPWSVIRYAFMTGSLLIFFKAFFFDYDVLSFFGIRQLMDFNKDSVNQDKSIKKTGLLGLIRHPMYLALIVYLWCQTFRWSDVVANIVLTAYVIIGTWLEERKLVLEFGDAYIQYQKEVPMLIPFTKTGLEKQGS
jgi:methanethiol S-methyltransferase